MEWWTPPLAPRHKTTKAEPKQLTHVVSFLAPMASPPCREVKEWGGSFQRLEDSDLRPQWLSLEAKIAMASNSDGLQPQSDGFHLKQIEIAFICRKGWTKKFARFQGHLEQRNPVGLASTPF